LAAISRRSPKGLEGSIFSMFTVVLNVGKSLQRLNSWIFIQLFGITETNFDNLTAYIIFCGETLFLGMPVLLCIDDTNDDDRTILVDQHFRKSFADFDHGRRVSDPMIKLADANDDDLVPVIMAEPHGRLITASSSYSLPETTPVAGGSASAASRGANIREVTIKEGSDDPPPAG